MEKAVYNKVIEALVMLSADIYNEVYQIVDGGYDVAVQAIIDATNRFEDEWEKDDCENKGEDFIIRLEKFEKEELCRLRKEWGKKPTTYDKYLNFVKENGKEPTYVSIQIMWKDDKQTMEVLCKLNNGYGDDDVVPDDEIFFTFCGIQSLIETEADKSLEMDGGEDFIITKVYDFE